MFTGAPLCATAVNRLPACVDGAFQGTWFTLHKGAHVTMVMFGKCDSVFCLATFSPDQRPT